MESFLNEFETPSKPQDNNEILQEAITLLNFKQPVTFSVHPFAQEIKRWKPDFLIEHLDYQESKHCPTCIKKVNHKITEVNDKKKFNQMMDHLIDQPIFSVDLEHHDEHSYSGITCLIQISTETHNFLIDPFQLNQEIKSTLKDVMECDHHIKIMHGCLNDLRWMQRDYNIFPWPVIDTQLIYRALARINGKQSEPDISLINLMKIYLPGEKLEKSAELTLSDFRIRPIPDNLKKYAAQDTYHLSGILFEMRQQFSKNSQFEGALADCVNELGTKKALYTGKIYASVVQEMESFRVTSYQEKFKALHAWRHDLACLNDENPNKILPTANLIVLSRLDATQLGERSDLSKMYELVPAISKELLSEENFYMMKTILRTSSYKPILGRVMPCGLCNLDTITVYGHEDWTTFSGAELNIDWRPRVQPGREGVMEKYMWDINAFPYSLARKIGLFSFTLQDMEYFTEEIYSFMKSLERKMICSMCHTKLGIHTEMDVVFHIGTSSSSAKLCCNSCLAKLNCSHKRFESGNKILQEFKTFSLQLSKRQSCQRRLFAISDMLRNCEMELMCQYCFCHLEATMLVKRETGLKPCCDGCDVRYMKTYENQGSTRFPVMDEVVSLSVKTLEKLLTYCAQSKVPVGFDHYAMSYAVLKEGHRTVSSFKEAGRKCKRFS